MNIITHTHNFLHWDDHGPPVGRPWSDVYSREDRRLSPPLGARSPQRRWVGPTSRLKNVATTQCTRLTRPASKRKTRGSKIKVHLTIPSSARRTRVCICRHEAGTTVVGRDRRVNGWSPGQWRLPCWCRHLLRGGRWPAGTGCWLSRSVRFWWLTACRWVVVGPTLIVTADGVL